MRTALQTRLERTNPIPEEGLIRLPMHNWMRQEPIEVTLETREVTPIGA